MSLEDASQLCADAAQDNLRVAADVAGSSRAATGFSSVDNLIGQALQRSRELLEEAAGTMSEAAANFTAQLFENETDT